MESATCAHQQNKIDTRRLHTGRIPIPNASLPNVCSFFSSVAPATIAAVPASSSSSKSCILYLFVFSCRTYRRGRIPFDSTWKRNKRVLCVWTIYPFEIAWKVWIQVSGLAYIHGSTARPPRWAITFVLFLVVNKAESDDIMRFCELDDVLPLLPLPVLYPLSVYYGIFMVFPFCAHTHICSKWPRK